MIIALQIVSIFLVPFVFALVLVNSFSNKMMSIPDGDYANIKVRQLMVMPLIYALVNAFSLVVLTLLAPGYFVIAVIAISILEIVLEAVTTIGLSKDEIMLVNGDIISTSKSEGKFIFHNAKRGEYRVLDTKLKKSISYNENEVRFSK